MTHFFEDLLHLFAVGFDPGRGENVVATAAADEYLLTQAKSRAHTKAS
jgi:hypothetical protein